MIQDQIREGNKLIAEFMSQPLNSTQVTFSNPRKEVIVDRSFKYNVSWDWLMPVIEKIEQQGCIVEIWLSLGKGCRIQKPQSKTQSWHVVMESNSTIEAVYFSVVEFIKWYNENSSK